MVTITVDSYQEWREAARRLLSDEVTPEAVVWQSAGAATLLFPPRPESSWLSGARAVNRVPLAFVELARQVSLHRSPRKWQVLYRLVWRLTRTDRHLLDDLTDDDVRAARDMAAQVRRDEHKMRAFVRFRPVMDDLGTRYVAWYQPDHLIVELAAPFFADRFTSMRWSILTPDVSAHWDGHLLTFSGGVEGPPAGPGDDAVTALWRAYYAATFNPARVNVRAMERDMPQRRWRQLPEAALIPELVASAGQRTEQIASNRGALTARPFMPVNATLDELRHAAPACRGCPLHAAATQVVFGEGDAGARVVLVGEQPGDAEDLAGRPFVGPAGQVLDRALAAAGIAREEVYLTNAVKHFSFEPRGKRRIHQTPRLSEMHACRPWLEAELQRIRPLTVVALGSTAARTLLGPQARVMALRGRVLEGHAWAARMIVTIHPSAVLRNETDGLGYFDLLVSDLALVKSLPEVQQPAAPPPPRAVSATPPSTGPGSRSARPQR